MRVNRSVWRDASGAWGPAGFVVATVVAARRQPGYSHRRHHISGLAAQHTRSAVVMIPGFTVLGAASLSMRSDHCWERALLRMAGMGTIFAGLFRCSDVRRPDPTKDPDATAAGSAHAIVSIVTFMTWTALPFVDVSRRRSSTSRAITIGNGVVTAFGSLRRD